MTHDYFIPGEYLHYKDGQLLDEKGYHLNWADFFLHRQGLSWDKGWNRQYKV